MMDRQSKRTNGGAERQTPIVCRCMPFGALNRRMSDLHGEAIYPTESIHDTLSTLAWAADEHLIEAFSAWDDDLMPWAADSRGRVVDQQDQLLIHNIQDFIEEHEICLTSFGCDLTRDAVFANGAITSPSESVRSLAFRKIERAFCIASSLRAESLRLFIGREGFEEPLNVSWERTLTQIAEGLKDVNDAVRYSSVKDVELLLGYNCSLRRHLYLATPSQAMFMLAQIGNGRNWRICLEEESLKDVSMFATIAQCDALAYLPFGINDSQGWVTNIANTVQHLAILKNIGWRGIAECIGMPSRTESIPEDRELVKRQFITNSITALTIAIQQSEQLIKDWDKGLSSTEVGIMAAAISANINPDDILRKATGVPEFQPDSPAPSMEVNEYPKRQPEAAIPKVPVPMPAPSPMPTPTPAPARTPTSAPPSKPVRANSPRPTRTPTRKVRPKTNRRLRG